MDLRCRISSQSNFQIVFRFVQHWTANDFSVKFWHFLKLQIRQFEHFKGKLKGDLFETLLRFSPKLRQNKQKTAAATRDAKSALCLKHSCANSRGNAKALAGGPQGGPQVAILLLVTQTMETSFIWYFLYVDAKKWINGLLGKCARANFYAFCMAGSNNITMEKRNPPESCLVGQHGRKTQTWNFSNMRKEKKRDMTQCLRCCRIWLAVEVWFSNWF